MRRFAYSCVIIGMAAGVLHAAGAVAPRVDLRAGTRLVALARKAMLRYLADRTPASRQRIPKALETLQSRRFRVAVSLWQRGRMVGHVLRKPGPLPRGVISAALEAMRSPLLPDRVTSDYLDRLTVEIEILGTPAPIEKDKLPTAFVAGLTGVMLSQGDQVAVVPPSESYMDSLDVEGAIRRCIRRITLNRNTVNKKRRWSIFLARHFIGQPREGVFSLYRGKVLLPPEAITKEMLATAAKQIGIFLKGCQDSSGQFIIDGVRPSLRNHIYATYALAKLARGNKRFLPVVNLAMRHIVPYIRAGEKGAYVAAPRETDQLSDTALLLSVLGELPEQPRVTKLMKKLRRGLLGAIRKDGSFSSRLDGAEGDFPASLTDSFMAFWALSRGETQVGTNGKKKLAVVRDRLIRAIPQDVEAVCWKIRAGLSLAPAGIRASSGPARKSLLPVAAARDVPLDEQGGFAPPGGRPTTLITALTAVNIASGLARPGQLYTRKPYKKAKSRLLGAQRFCYQMMYRVPELYFQPGPRSWRGAVRERPGSKKVTLEACAAAIEALLCSK